MTDLGPAKLVNAGIEKNEREILFRFEIQGQRYQLRVPQPEIAKLILATLQGAARLEALVPGSVPQPAGSWSIPVPHWEIGEIDGTSLMVLSFEVAQGVKLNFSMDKKAAQPMAETLLAILGLSLPTPPKAEQN